MPSLPDTPHDLHAPQVGEPQQKPSTQLPVPHWWSVVQACACAMSATQVPPTPVQ